MKAIFLPALQHHHDQTAMALLPFMQPQRNMRAHYLPAILPTTLEDRWLLRPIHWMDPRLEGTMDYYPYTLISYYHWATTKFTFPPGTFIFGDSGGFTIGSLGVSIDPADVIRWQIRNCTVGVILDFPPYGDMQNIKWTQGLETSARHIKRALPIYAAAREEGTDFRWWGVIQGKTLEDLEEWHKVMTSEYSFSDTGEGWAMKPIPYNEPSAVGRVFGFIQKKGIRRVHLLATTGVPATTTFLSLANIVGLDLLTYDSATSSHTGINRGVFKPDEDWLGWSLVSEVARRTEEKVWVPPSLLSREGRWETKVVGGETFARDYLKEECQCGSCSFFRADLKEVPEKINEEYVKYRMIFHNTLIAKQVYETITAEAAKEPETFIKRRLGPKVHDQVMQGFDGRIPVPSARGASRSLLDLSR